MKVILIQWPSMRKAMKATHLAIGLGMLVPAPAVRAQTTGILVVAHGANPGWNQKVREIVAQVRWSGPVEVAFLMGAEADSSGWNAGIGRLVRRGAADIIAVPLMVSSHGGHYRQIRYYAGEVDVWPADLGHDHGPRVRPPVPVRVTPALDGAAELGRVLRDRWSTLTMTDRSRPLLLVAHGPSTDEEAELWVRDLARAAREIGADVPVEIGLLRDDAAPPVRVAAIERIHAQVRAMAPAPGDSVAVLSVLVSSGRINAVTIPKDLAGLPVSYTSAALAPHAELARWIERMAELKREPPSGDRQ